MTLFYYDPIFLEHDTGLHPENSQRIPPVMRQLQRDGLIDRCTRPEWVKATTERVCLVHSPRHVQHIEQFADQGGGRIESDTVVSRPSFDVALMAAGAVCDATERVVRGEHGKAFCLVRPPGHHATPDEPMGFCLFNNVAIGARVATRELGIKRVMIVDFDVHHGNGTQDVFWEDPDVGYFSMHRSNFYPGTGRADETGAGDGIGTTMNVPIRFGTSRDEQLSLFASRLGDFAAKIRPELIMISAGFDSHKNDPIGSLGLESQDFATLTRCICDLAEEYAEGRVVSALEGGYNPNALAESVAIHLGVLLGDAANQ